MTTPSSQRIADLAVVGLFAGWLAGTVLGQHPHRGFDRVRQLSAVARIPDWRFFAPEPGRTDNHVLVRLVRPDGSATPWESTHEYLRRRWWHMVYHPAHRIEKGYLDLASGFTMKLAISAGPLEELPEYALMTRHVRRVVSQRPDIAEYSGFQFLLVEDAGYDEEADFELRMVSSLEPVVV